MTPEEAAAREVSGCPKRHRFVRAHWTDGSDVGELRCDACHAKVGTVNVSRSESGTVRLFVGQVEVPTSFGLPR